jgi:hypothetical protein
LLLCGGKGIYLL